MRRIAQWLAIGVLIAGPASSQGAAAPASAGRFATLIELDGPIGPAMSRYVEQSLADARDRHSAVVILQDGYARRSRYLHARHHQGDTGLAGAGGGLRGAERRAGGQRRNLHSLRVPRRRDGSGDQLGRRDADCDRRRAEYAAGAAGRQPRRRQEAKRRGGDSRRIGERAQGRQRCRRLHPFAGAIARAQCRVGRSRRARGREPVRRRCARRST